jgi:hypothetical protein
MQLQYRIGIRTLTAIRMSDLLERFPRKALSASERLESLIRDEEIAWSGIHSAADVGMKKLQMQQITDSIRLNQLWKTPSCVELCRPVRLVATARRGAVTSRGTRRLTSAHPEDFFEKGLSRTHTCCNHIQHIHTCTTHPFAPKLERITNTQTHTGAHTPHTCFDPVPKRWVRTHQLFETTSELPNNLHTYMQNVFNVSVGVGGTVDVLEQTVSRGLDNGIPSEIDTTW